MIRLPQLLRAARWVASPVLGLAVLACAPAAPAFTPATRTGSEASPLNLSSPATSSHASGGGPSIVRTIVGLLIVIAVIWGLSWILRQVKSGRANRGSGSGLASIATLPLSPGRSLHVVRAGRDYLLLGSAEHSVAPIHRYTEEQAREIGLLDAEDPPDPDGDSTGGSRWGRARPLQLPGDGSVRSVGVNSVLERLREWTVRR